MKKLVKILSVTGVLLASGIVMAFRPPPDVLFINLLIDILFK